VTMCEGTLPFASISATGFYHSLPLRRLIGALKYDGVTAAGADVDAYLRDARMTIPSDAMIIPMPLADRRERERGFNQAMWIAERLQAIALSLDIMRDPVVVRRSGKYAQADLEHNEKLRRANISGQFSTVKRINRPILLVDDVVTTGSTAAEVARTLIAAGAPGVHLFALAVGK
jgi:ComF family protein